MRSGDLLFQLARAQKPEPRQLIPRDVVKGRRAVRDRKVAMVVGGCMLVL